MVLDKTSIFLIFWRDGGKQWQATQTYNQGKLRPHVVHILCFENVWAFENIFFYRSTY